MKIAAVFGDVGHLETKNYVEQMCRAQVACDWHKYEIFEVQGGAIGIVRTSERYGNVPMFLKGSTGNFLAISGVPTKEGKLKDFLQNVVEMSSSDAFQALTEMDGAYAALFWQESEKKVLFVTDFMGFQPVYLHRADKGIAIASEIKAFSVAKVVPVKPDPAGWGAFVTFGHTIGERTQLSGVSRLRGVRLEYTPDINCFNSEPYWDWPDRQPEMDLEDISLSTILDCLRGEVDAYREYGVDENTLLMSSGFDSRLILCLLTEASIPLNSLSVQQKGHFFGAEGKIGQKVAKGFGVADAKLVNPLSGYDNELAKLRYLIMNDVATPGKSLFISSVAGHVENLSGAVWEGFAPGYTITQVTDNNMESYLSRKKLADDSDNWQSAFHVFSDEFIDSMKTELKNAV